MAVGSVASGELKKTGLFKLAEVYVHPVVEDPGVISISAPRELVEIENGKRSLTHVPFQS